MLIKKKKKIKNIKKYNSFQILLQGNVDTKMPKIYNKMFNLNFEKIFIFIFIILFLMILLFLLFIYRKTPKLHFYQSKKLKILNNHNTLNELKNNNIFNSLNFSLFFENRINELKRNSIEIPLPNDIKFKPLMTLNELKAFSYFMKPENIYFEFGSGGSTNVASYYKLNNIYSVESDVNWHNKLKNNSINAIYLTVDLKTNGNIGIPGPGTNVEDWKRYIQAYKSEYNADIILIDGRFRVACGLDIFSKIKNNTLILIHDYENRDYYHILEKYYIKIRKWDTLSAFFKNPKITSVPKEVYEKYIYIYD